MRKKVMLSLLVAFLLGVLSQPLLAQPDTVAASGVTIVSSFRPSLKQASKINFSAMSLTADTNRSVLPYRIPDRQLVLDYSIRAIQPLAYTTDTVKPFSNRSFVKVGYGNLRNPYLRVGIEGGNGGTKGFSLSGRYLSLTQHPDAKDMRYYRNGEVKASGYTQLKRASYKLLSSVEYRNERVNNNLLYDSARSLSAFPKDSLRQEFSILHAQVQLLSTAPVGSGITLNPLVRVYQFFDAKKNAETYLQLQAPLQKQIGDSWWVQTVFSVQALRYKHQNTLLSITPSVRYQHSSFQVWAGVSPTWNTGRFAALPQLAVTYALPGKKSSLMAGWNGRWNQNSYRELASLNPWIWAPTALRTSRITERYMGVKGQVNSQMDYDLRAQLLTTEDAPLFLNDTSHSPASAFRVIYEERLEQLQLQARIAYRIATQFSFSSQLLFTHFFKPRVQPVAWGLLPLEWQSSFRLALTDELWLQSDLVIFKGAHYRDRNNKIARSAGAADLNAGLTFAISRSFQVWTQFNNLFNQPYQRWNLNPVAGFNCSGGIVFSFDQKKKP